MNIQGKLIHVFDRQQVTDTFAKQSIVIDTGGQYPQQVKVDCTGKAMDNIPAVGTDVTAHIDIRGRAYERKDGQGKDWFTSINCWRIETGTNQEPTDHTNSFKDDVPF